MTGDSTSGERVIVRRVIAAPRERVFRTWTEPEQLTRCGNECSAPGPSLSS